jgi:AraC-like DNA-binding protein
MLLDIARTLPVEPFVIDHLVDAHGRYRLDLDPQFPLAIRVYRFAPVGAGYSMNWHERLEIFVPLSGRGVFQMGERVLEFAEGDLLVVDNLKLHGLREFTGKDPRAMTITFNPELVYNIASPLCDFAYLTPFHCHNGTVTPVVRRDDPLAPPVHAAIKRLVACYGSGGAATQVRMGCKAYLLELLFQLAPHFAESDVAHSEYVRQQERARRLGRLVDHLREHHARRITVNQAARMVGMSASQFMKFFKQATGTTFITYVTHVRLAHASELLRTTDLAVAEIAARVGLSDHAYFDRKFKQRFGTSPREMRERRSARKVS